MTFDVNWLIENDPATLDHISNHIKNCPRCSVFGESFHLTLWIMLNLLNDLDDDIDKSLKFQDWQNLAESCLAYYKAIHNFPANS